MFFYISIFLVLLVLSFMEMFCVFPSAYKKKIIWIFSIFYVILSGIYAGPAGDYGSYELSYFYANINSLFQKEGYEWLYRILSVIVRLITKEYTFFRMVIASIVMVLWYKIYTYWEDVLIEKYAMFIMMVVWALNFGNLFVIRSTVAVAICMYSVRFIEQKKFIKFVICTILAMGFHMMSMVWFGAYFVYYSTKFRKLYYTLIVLGICLQKVMPQVLLFFAEKMGAKIYGRVYTYILVGDKYVSNYSMLFNTVKACLNIGVLLIIFIYTTRRKEVLGILSNEQNYFNLYLLGTIIYVCAMCSSIELARASHPYNATQYILLPRLFDLPEVSDDRKMRFIVFTGISFYLFLRMFITMNSNMYIPFNTIFM